MWALFFTKQESCVAGTKTKGPCCDGKGPLHYINSLNTSGITSFSARTPIEA
jgi:hypothetical protein